MKRRHLSISCSTPALILTITAQQLGGHRNHPVILMVTTIYHPIQQMYSAGTCEVEGKELYYMGADFLVRKPDLLKVEKPERDDKLQTMNEKIEFLTFHFNYNYYYNAKGEEGSYYSTYMRSHNKSQKKYSF